MRRIQLIAIIGLLGLLVGCGGDSKPAPHDAPPPIPQPGPQPEPKPPAPKDIYELDPAKHVIPATAVAGRLAGKPFTPDRIELEGDKLTFRQGKDFFADLSIDIFLKDVKNPADGAKLVVKPAQKWTDNIPSLQVSTRKGNNPLPKTDFVNDGYALTLELGKVEKGRAAGKIFLCLPGDERSYLAGTFTAARKRTLSEPPGPEDVPYIQGSITPPVKKGQLVLVGYVGIPADGKVISEVPGGLAPEDGDGGAVRSTTFEPRTAGVRFEKFTPHFDFTHLPPGRYFIFTHLKDGPTAWAWVTVPADGKITADLKLDAQNVGTVEVKLPPNEKEARLLPADLGSPPPDEAFLNQLSFSLDLRAEAKDGKATIANVPAGKYQVRAGTLRAEVEVTAGKTTMVELKPAKK